jgi:hypothetical protein
VQVIGRILTGFAAVGVLALWISRTEHRAASAQDRPDPAPVAASAPTPRAMLATTQVSPGAGAREVPRIEFAPVPGTFGAKLVQRYMDFAAEQRLSPDQDRAVRGILRDAKVNTEAVMDANAEADREALMELRKKHPRPGTVLRPPGVQLAEDLTKLDDDITAQLARVLAPEQVRRFRAYFVNVSDATYALPFAE